MITCMHSLRDNRGLRRDLTGNRRHRRDSIMRGCFYGNTFGYGWGGGWWIEVILTVLVIVGIACLVFRIFSHQKNNFDRRDSLDILKRRLASGEISLDEFEKLKKVL